MYGGSSGTAAWRTMFRTATIIISAGSTSGAQAVPYDAAMKICGVTAILGDNYPVGEEVMVDLNAEYQASMIFFTATLASVQAAKVTVVILIAYF